MISNNVKTLGKVFVFVFIVIFLIILFVCLDYIFSVNREGYIIPTTTTKFVDTSFKDLDTGEKLKYNRLLNERFLLSLTNAIDNRFKYLNINLLESEEAKFKFIYTNYTFGNQNVVTKDVIDTESKRLFNTILSEDNYSKYLNTDKYFYTVNNINSICLKAKKEKINNNKLIVRFDVLNYNSLICNQDYLDYSDEDVINEAQITVSNDEKRIIYSFMLMNKEG